MAKTILQAGHAPGTASTANTTQYWLPGATLVVPSTTEANKQIILRSAGTISNLTVFLGANSVNTATVFRIRLNTANGTSSISVASGATGEFEDTTGTDSITAGDVIALQSVPGTTGTFTPTMMQCSFAATTNTVTKFVSLTGRVTSTTNTTGYIGVGNHGSQLFTTTETWSLTRIRKAGTARNIACFVSGNSITANSTLRLRKNSANANQVVTITASTTGTFEDVSNTDAIVSSDDIGYQLVTGATGGSLVVQSMQLEYETTDNSGMIFDMDTSGNTIAFGVTTRLTLSGGTGFNGTESVTHIQPNEAYTFSDLIFRLATNSVNSTTTVRLRKSEVDTTLVISVGASTTGLFEDNVNTEVFTATEEPNFQVVTAGSSGTQLFTMFGVHYTGPAPPPPASTGVRRSLAINTMKVMDIQSSARRNPIIIGAHIKHLIENFTRRYLTKWVLYLNPILTRFRDKSSTLPQDSIMFSRP